VGEESSGSASSVMGPTVPIRSRAPRRRARCSLSHSNRSARVQVVQTVYLLTFRLLLGYVHRGLTSRFAAKKSSRGQDREGHRLSSRRLAKLAEKQPASHDPEPGSAASGCGAQKVLGHQGEGNVSNLIIRPRAPTSVAERLHLSGPGHELDGSSRGLEHGLDETESAGLRSRRARGSARGIWLGNTARA